MRHISHPVVAALILVAGNAYAAGIAVTAPLRSGNASDALCCVANLNTKEAISPKIEFVAVDGSVHTGLAIFITAGGFSCFGDATPVSSYCRVSGVSSTKVRVSLCMTDAAGNCISTVTAPTK